MKYEIDAVKIQTSLEKRSLAGQLQWQGELEASVGIRGDFDEMGKMMGESPLYLHASLEATDGSTADQIFPLLLELEMGFCMRVEQPVLWNAEYPQMYRLQMTVCMEDGTVLEQRMERAAFYLWEILDGKTCLNGEPIPFRAELLPGVPVEEAAFLRSMKRRYKNALLVPAGTGSESLRKQCLCYGIYCIEENQMPEYGGLLAKEERFCQAEGQENPDLALQVVQNGVLIENKSVFLNTNVYELYYEIRRENKCYQSGSICADVPAGSSRFVELPFQMPGEPGIYCYRVSLRLKEDAFWAEKGYAVVKSEAQISNFYEKEETGNLSDAVKGLAVYDNGSL